MSGQDAGTLKDKTQAFLSEFFQQGESLVRELIEENERLKQALKPSDRPLPAPAQISSGVVEALMSKVDRLENECAEIRKIAGSVRRESGGYRNRLENLEREHYQLAAVHVAANQFHSAVTLEEVIRTVTEILLNFVGVGHFTLYCTDEARGLLFPVAREGGDLTERTELGMDAFPVAEVTAARSAWRAGSPRGRTADAIMHLPLVAGDRTVGLARLESFLPQKSDFEENDDGLLELISEHAGLAIEAAWVRTHADVQPMAREALQDLVGGA